MKQNRISRPSLIAKLQSGYDPRTGIRARLETIGLKRPTRYVDEVMSGILQGGQADLAAIGDGLSQDERTDDFSRVIIEELIS